VKFSHLKKHFLFCQNVVMATENNKYINTQMYLTKKYASGLGFEVASVGVSFRSTQMWGTIKHCLYLFEKLTTQLNSSESKLLRLQNFINVRSEFRK